MKINTHLKIIKISEKQLISTNEEESNKPRKLNKCSWNNCHFKSEFKQSLNRHKSRHLNKQFVCDFVDCNKKFNFKTNLVRHKRTHFEDKRFKCDFKDCNKIFKTSKQMEIHRNSLVQCFSLMSDACNWVMAPKIGN